MDFSTFDNRGPAETGTRVPLVNPVTGEGIGPEDAPSCVIVRGVASRTVQAEMRKKALARAKSNAPALDVMEDVHQSLIDAALPLVVGFENVERNGAPLTASVEDIRWFLDLTFPMMEKDGQQWKMVNRPFAAQIAEAAGDQDRFLPNAAQG